MFLKGFKHNHYDKHGIPKERYHTFPEWLIVLAPSPVWAGCYPIKRIRNDCSGKKCMAG